MLLVLLAVLQEAELVRLQGQAVAARRRVKSVTAATLGELVERYGSAAAGWDSPTAQGAGSRCGSAAVWCGSCCGFVAYGVWLALTAGGCAVWESTSWMWCSVAGAAQCTCTCVSDGGLGLGGDSSLGRTRQYAMSRDSSSKLAKQQAHP